MSTLDTSNMVIEDMDKFIEKFQMDNYESVDEIALFDNIISDATSKIGAGAIGTIFDIRGTNFVLKVSNICDPSATNTILKDMCALSKNGNIVFKIPYTPTNKTVVFAPNYITETIVGKIMSECSPNFVKFRRFYFDHKTHRTFIIMEKLESMLPKMTSHKRFLYLIFQVLHALICGQRKHLFVHNDLHAGNILVRQHTTKILNCYEIGNGKYLYTFFDYDNVITDFGYSRCETAENIIIPQIYVDQDAMDSYLFNEYVDALSFLTYLAISIDSTDSSIKFNLSNSEADICRETLLFLYEMSLNNGKPFVDITTTNSLFKGWRVLASKLNDFSGDVRIPNPSELFQRLVTEFEHNQLPSILYMKPEKIHKYLQTNELFVSNFQIYFGDIVNVNFIPMPKSKLNPYFLKYKLGKDPLTTIDTKITINYIKNLDKIDPLKSIRRTTASYNFTLPLSIVNGLRDFSSQHIFQAIINQELLDDGYKFVLDCCRVDVRDYFKSSGYDSGVVINSVFFNLTDDFTPIGYYKTKGIEFDNPIPEKYEKFYAIVAVDENGRLKIDDYNNRYKYNQVFACGPMICKDGIGLFDDDNIITKDKDGSFLFLSKGMTSNKVSTLETINGITGQLHNSNDILPGELKHGGNPNPRSMLGIDAQGHIHMIRIEGRDRRGTGMDFVQMSQLCVVLGLQFSLCLDGGGSSRMAWKKAGQNVISIAGIDTQSYPVGGVFAFVK